MPVSISHGKSRSQLQKTSGMKPIHRVALPAQWGHPSAIIKFNYKDFGLFLDIYSSFSLPTGDSILTKNSDSENREGAQGPLNNV